MPEAGQDGPRFLYERDARKAAPSRTVDVMDLLAQLADQAEELAKTTVRQKHAEANLKRKTREMEAERKAHIETRQRLEDVWRDLEAESREVAAECRDLEAVLAREREVRTALEADLKGAQHRVAALQQQLQIAWARLQQRRTSGGARPWWSRLVEQARLLMHGD